MYSSAMFIKGVVRIPHGEKVGFLCDYSNTCATEVGLEFEIKRM